MCGRLEMCLADADPGTLVKGSKWCVCDLLLRSLAVATAILPLQMGGSRQSICSLCRVVHASPGGTAAGATTATQDGDGPDVEALSEALTHLFEQHQRLVDLVTDRASRIDCKSQWLLVCRPVPLVRCCTAAWAPAWGWASFDLPPVPSHRVSCSQSLGRPRRRGRA